MTAEEMRDEEDDDEYDEVGGGNRLLGFMFGNVDGSGDLDVDYLDEDAKEHLSALADKLGPSLTDIELSKSSPTPTDASEQDYDEKAEDAVDYEDIDEQYDGPEIQNSVNEDELLPEKEYLSSNIPLEFFNPKVSVFDDDNYDEEEDEAPKENEVSRGEQLEPGASMEPSFDSLRGLSSDAYVPCAESPVPEVLPLQLEDDEEQASFEQGQMPSKNEPSLPILYEEDGVVVLRFSEIFGAHYPMKRMDRKGRNHRHYPIEELSKMMIISDIVEEDEEKFLRAPSYNILVSRNFSSACNLDASVEDAISEVHMHEKDASLSAQSMKEDASSRSFIGHIPETIPDFYPLDQLEWEDKILWGNSPTTSHGCSELCMESESHSDAETEDQRRENNNLNDEDHIFSNSCSFMKTVYAPDSLMLAGTQSLEIGYQGNTFRCLDSTLPNGDVCMLLKDNIMPYDVYKGDILYRFSKLSFLNRDLLEGSWVDQIIWDSVEAIQKPKLILDLEDNHMLFEVLDHKDGECIRSRASAVVITRSSKHSAGNVTELQNYGIASAGQFNISNDKFYSNRKMSQQVKSQAKRRASHGIKILHSIPALRLQTMKLKLTNKDVANFHRPRAVWYPHDYRFAAKFHGTLRTKGPIKVIMFCLGGKILKLNVDAAESVSSVKLKASRKLDLRMPEKLKLFFSGKILEDDKSLASQNICPNSVLHLASTTINVWSRAQRLPGENKPIRPPGAFKKRSDLSVKDGHVFLMEYCEERPLLLGNAGMGARLCTYYKKTLPSDQNALSIRNSVNGLGTSLVLDPAEKSPFLGDIGNGRSQSCLETNMYRAPVFPHKLLTTDYLLVRSAKGTLSIRRIDKLFVVGQQEPHMEVLSPGAKNVQMYLATRMLVHVYREFRAKEKLGVIPNVRADELAANFSGLTDAFIRKRLKHCADFKKGANGNWLWVKRKDFRIPSEEELRRMLAPEAVCSYESMQAGLYHLKRLGISQLTLPAGLSSAVNQLDEAIALAAASHIERELQITPWNLSSNFVACTNQNRENLERLEITGVGDPSGRGLGFSFVRVTPKAPVSGASVKKKAVAARGSTTVTGTDADLRRLSMDAAREVLLKFNVPEEQIAKLVRWHRIALVRKLSSELASTGIKVDAMTLNKFARGQRMSFLQLQQQAKEKCQEIWERQLQSLSADYADYNESDSEANSDLDSFAGDLENLLDAEELDEEESGHANSRGDKDVVRLFKMRRCPPQDQSAEEIEDDEEEAALISRLLDDNVDEMKKKRLNGTDVGADNVDPSIKNASFVRQFSGVSYHELSLPLKDTMVHDLDQIDIFQNDIYSSLQEKSKKVSIRIDGTLVGQQKKKPLLTKEGLKILKEKKQTDKSLRESIICGACGQVGHMRTNKNCPKNKDMENPEHETASVKTHTPDFIVTPGQQKAPSKKPTVKGFCTITQAEILDGGEKISSQTKIPLVKFRSGLVDKPPSEKNLVLARVSDRQIGGHDKDIEPKSAGKISKIRFSSKMKSEKPSPHGGKPPVLVLRPPEKDKPSTKIVIKHPKLARDVEQVRDGYDAGFDLDSRKMKKIDELSGFVDHMRLVSPWSKREPIHDNSTFLEVERRKKNGNGEESRRMLEDKRNAHEEHLRFFEGRRSEEVIRMDETRKLKKKKKKKTDFSDDYLMDHHRTRRNEQRLMERNRAVKRRYSFDEDSDFTPTTKRRRGGEVVLSNILGSIVDSLRENHEISYLFLKPVSKKEAPDYLTVIARPMDLSTIREKVRNMEYKNREDFRHDVWQITFNAHRYNDGRNPGIPPLADQLLELCDYHLDLNHQLLDQAESETQGT